MPTRNYKKGKIAPINLFFFCFVSRMIISLTYVQSVISTNISSDIAFTLLITAVLSVLFALPALLAVRAHKNPLGDKYICVFYALYFVFVATVNTMRFSYFASSILNVHTPAVYFSLIIGACAVYGASRKIEALSRLGSVIFALLVLSLVLILACTAPDFSYLNFFPLFQKSTADIFQDALLLACNASEIPLYLCLAGKVNGKSGKPFVFGILTAVLAIAAVFAMAVGVMGDYAYYQPFPVYTLAGLAKLGGSMRLDSMFTAVWIFCLFLKAAVFLYAAAHCLQCSALHTSKKRALPASAVILGAFIIVGSVFYESFFSEYAKIMVCALFAVSAVVLPILFLIFRKKDLGEDLLEKF